MTVKSWTSFPLELTPHESEIINKRASELGLHPQVYARKILVRGVKQEIDDDPSSRVWGEV